MLNFYQQEREKINYDWIIAKKELEDLKSEVINKDREIEDLRENQMMTINLYKQKYIHSSRTFDTNFFIGLNIFSLKTKTTRPL